ncbi:hypothetical protein [Cupriavidus sp. IDO]|uniref:hypothetical protein n=1 Tax=Cupriavidus sp. IDO TaxID=1539142 RepID=UPI0005794F9E|nr:hypothetical protein [Cupriavidus sp. IDO]KWR90887.1 hypothetical protein RM96_07125 [Cupriavidus sp. IDO]
MSIVRSFFAVLLCVISVGAMAQAQQARGKASVTYTALFGGAPTEAKTKALTDARVKAVETYYAEAGEAESENFDAIREKVLANPDRYILDTTVLNEEDRTDTKTYSVTVRVTLNVAQLRNAVKSNSATAATPKGEKSKLTFLFVSRTVDSTTSYDDRVYKRVDRSVKASGNSSESQNGTEGESVASAKISTNASVNRKASVNLQSSATSETGGSVTRRASASTWRLIPSANLNSVFTGVFGKGGFKVLEAGFVEPYTHGKLRVANVENDYKSGNDLKTQTLQDVVAGLKMAQIPYLAFGTLDVGLADKDPATGLMRVAVTVNAKILDASSAIPENVATVGPVQYAGVGATEDEARTNALKSAANSAARELISQVTNVGLK